jgi:hypothetical protein
MPAFCLRRRPKIYLIQILPEVKKMEIQRAITIQTAPILEEVKLMEILQDFIMQTALMPAAAIVKGIPRDIITLTAHFQERRKKLQIQKDTTIPMEVLPVKVRAMARLSATIIPTVLILEKARQAERQPATTILQDNLSKTKDKGLYDYIKLLFLEYWKW